LPCYFDLQIIQASLQVKTRLRASLRGFFRISLGFKQLARGLHAPFRGGLGLLLLCLRQAPSSE
jgi:hypothetical protein